MAAPEASAESMQPIEIQNIWASAPMLHFSKRRSVTAECGGNAQVEDTESKLHLIIIDCLFSIKRVFGKTINQFPLLQIFLRYVLQILYFS